MNRLRIHMMVAAARLRPWQHVTRMIRDFDSTKGVGKWLALPGVVSLILNTVLDPDDDGVWRSLSLEGWRRPRWAQVIPTWVVELMDADFGIEFRTFSQESADTITFYDSIGVAVLRHQGEVVDVCCSPDSTRFREWFNRQVDAAFEGHGFGQLIRFVQNSSVDQGQPVRVRHKADYFGRVARAAWSVEFSGVGDQFGNVEGPWAPNLAEVERALAGGRTVLLFGPPGAGKTRMAMRAGSPGRIVLVPGTAFGGSLTGRDAAEIVDLFGATVLIVDDMPASATVALLEEFEVLSRRGVSVAVTVMTDGSRPHLSGLRPGRVDEMFEFGIPDADGREALLRHFAPGIDWLEAARHELCEGLTPAYLKELARRVTGPSCRNGWFEALQSLSVQRAVAT
jgi:hypothetical protein